MTNRKIQRWQDEARILGLNSEQMRWIREVILTERQLQADFTEQLTLKRISNTKCECCDLNHVFTPFLKIADKLIAKNNQND